MVFIKESSKLTAVAYATNHTVNISMNTVDRSTKDNGAGQWQENGPGLRNWSINTDCLVGDDSNPGLGINALLSKLSSGETVELVFAYKTERTVKDVPTQGWTPDSKNQWSGKALVTSLTLNAQNGQDATWSATFTGCGALEQVGSGIATASTIALQESTPVATASAEPAKTSK